MATQVGAEGLRRRGRRTARAWTASTWNSTPRCGADASRSVAQRLDRADLVVGEHAGDTGSCARRCAASTSVRVDAGRSGRPAARRPRSRTSRGAQRVTTAWCSTALVTIRWPLALPAQAAPLSARLVASVPPAVKTISRGSRADGGRRSARAPHRAPCAPAAPEAREPTTGCRSRRSGAAASPRAPRGAAASWPRGRDRSAWSGDCTRGRASSPGAEGGFEPCGVHSDQPASPEMLVRRSSRCVVLRRLAVLLLPAAVAVGAPAPVTGTVNIGDPTHV